MSHESAQRAVGRTPSARVRASTSQVPRSARKGTCEQSAKDARPPVLTVKKPGQDLDSETEVVPEIVSQRGHVREWAAGQLLTVSQLGPRWLSRLEHQERPGAALEHKRHRSASVTEATKARLVPRVVWGRRGRRWCPHPPQRSCTGLP